MRLRLYRKKDAVSAPMAVHRAIVCVDVQGYTDRSRTNVDQIAVRDGMYRALDCAFTRSGVAWKDCYHEDRGDGVLILVPSQIPKNLLVTGVPRRLADELCEHNQVHPGPARIRLRLAVHAGEVYHDKHGVAATAVNVAFRLLEAEVLKRGLAQTPGVLAVIASQWFYEEVIRHTPASRPETYRQVRVSVKETETTAWLCLPDHLRPPGVAAPVVLPRLPRGGVAITRQLSAVTAGFIGRISGSGQAVRAQPDLAGVRPAWPGAGHDRLTAGWPGRGIALDASLPHIARVYDYLLGGKDNFAADRAVGDQIITSLSAAQVGVRAQRDLLGRVIQYLVGEVGLRQLLDIGSGLPAEENPHEIAQRIDPATRVVYLDNDPIVLSHARALLADNMTTFAAQGDLKDPAGILANPDVRERLDWDQPIGLLLCGILHYILDEEKPAELVAALSSALPSGSYIFIHHLLASDDPASAILQAEMQKGLGRTQFRTFTQVKELFGDLELVEPGVVLVPDWRPCSRTPSVRDHPVLGLACAGVARKP
jgi:hypothetical protein